MRPRFHFKDFIPSYLWLNLGLMLVFLAGTCVWYVRALQKEKLFLLAAAERARELISKDIAVLDALATLNAGKKQPILIPAILQSSLKVYCTSQIMINRNQARMSQEIIQHQGTFLFMNNEAEFVIRKIFLSNSKVVKIEGKFYVENFLHHLSELVGAKLGLETSVSETNALLVFRGLNFTIVLNEPRSGIFAFIVSHFHILLSFFLLIVIFNVFFIKLFCKTINAMQGYIPQEIKQLNLELQKRESCITQYKKEVGKLNNRQNSLLCSLSATEKALTAIFIDFKEQINNIYSFLKTTQITNDNSALIQLQSIFERFDLNHIVDPMHVDIVNCCELISRVLKLHSSLAQEKSISTLQKGARNVCIECNEAVFFRVIASLLYRAILASAQGGQVSITVSKCDDGVVIDVQDSGYRASYDVETDNPFKMTLNQLMEGLERYCMAIEIKSLGTSGAICSLRYTKQSFVKEKGKVIPFCSLRSNKQ